MQRGFSGPLFPAGGFFYSPVISRLRAVNFGSGRSNGLNALTNVTQGGARHKDESE
jgi:hypothetical protein